MHERVLPSKPMKLPVACGARSVSARRYPTDPDMTADRETLIRVAQVAADAPSLDLSAGDPPAAITLRWVVVSICRDANGKPPHYGVYLLAEDGSIREVLFFESCQIALEQAQSLCGAQRLRWRTGAFEVPEDGHLDPTEFSNYFAG